MTKTRFVRDFADYVVVRAYHQRQNRSAQDQLKKKVKKAPVSSREKFNPRDDLLSESDVRYCLFFCCVFCEALTPVVSIPAL